MKWFSGDQPARTKTAEVVEPLEWFEIIPPLDANPMFESAQEVCVIPPLECATLWIDFGQKVDNNAKYTCIVSAVWGDGVVRKVSRADIDFRKPTPGWPPAVVVNNEPQRLDGMLDFAFEVHPFMRTLTIVQTAGRASVVRVALLTGFTQPASVQA